MWSIFKKKLNSELEFQNNVVVGMFQSWTYDVFEITLTLDQVRDITRRVLNAEKILASEEDIDRMAKSVHGEKAYEQYRTIRKETSADSKMREFILKLDLPESYITPKPKPKSKPMPESQSSLGMTLEQFHEYLNKKKDV